MLRNMNAKLDAIFFCHGVINYMGGIEGNLIEWDKVSRVNVRSTMQVLSICMPFLRMTGGSATVLSASAGEKPWPGHTIFNCNMASLNMMVRVAALENAHHKVRLNAVAPGYIIAQSNQARQNQEFQNALDDEGNNKVMNEAAMLTPLIKIHHNPDGCQDVGYQLANSNDVVNQMLFLGSSDASFINGEVMVIDGGLSVTSNGFAQYVQQAEYNDNIIANKD